MSRLAAACLVVACFVVACLAPALAGSALAQSTPPASHRPPPIPGTLDPATGKFTPDATGSGSGSSDNVKAGVLYVLLDLDAVHASSVSVACSVQVDYTVDIFHSGTFIDAGSDSTEPINLSHSPHKFSDVLDFPYAVDTGIFPQDVFFNLDVKCRYTFDPDTTIFHEVIKGDVDDFNSESTPVVVKGSMNGQHLG